MCFVLVLGSLGPCLPAFSSIPKTVKEDPIAADSVYTVSQSEYLSNSGWSQIQEKSHARYTSILAVRRQRQGDLHEFEASLGYTGSSRYSRAT